MEHSLIKSSTHIHHLFGFDEIRNFFTPENQEILHEVNCHLDYFDEQLEVLEGREIDLFYQVPSSVADDLLEIKRKIIQLEKRLKNLNLEISRKAS